MHIDLLNKRAFDTPDRVALTVEGEALTWRGLRDDAVRMAAGLASLGLARGGRCALVLPTSLDAVRGIYAAQWLGAAPVSIDPGLPVRSQLRRVRAVRPAVVVASPASAASILEDGTSGPSMTIATPTSLSTGPAASVRTPVEIDPDEVAYLQLTSGTTGEPRAAMISYRALGAALAGIQERLGIGPHDVMASWAPLHSSPGLVRYVFGAVYFDCPSHLIRPSALQLSRWLELITSVRATVTSAPDVAYRLAARIDSGLVDLRSLRVATSGGEVVRADTIRAFEQHFQLPGVVQPAYGLTEATVIATSTAPGEALTTDANGRVSCGRPIYGLEVRIDRRDDSRPDGEILLRGPSLFHGYFDDEEGTQAVWRDGWLHTGDWGVMIDGQLYPVSRERLLIKRAGASLAPREIEEPLEQIDDVLSAAAVGRTRSDGLTEELVIVVETRRDTRADLRAIAGQVEQAVTATIGSLPAQVIIVKAAAIPRTTGGKIRHAELRQLVAEGSLLNAALFAS